MNLRNQRAVPRLQFRRFPHDYLRNSRIEISCFFMFFRCRFRGMKNPWFGPPFWHPFGSLWPYFPPLFRHRFWHGFLDALFPDFWLPLETVGRLFEIFGRKMVAKREPLVVLTPSPVSSLWWPLRIFDVFGIQGRFLMDFGWVLDGFWMDFGWLLNGFWMNFTWLLDGF